MRPTGDRDAVPSTLDRRRFLAAAATAGAGLAAASRALAGARDEMPPPNVLFILADQWRFSAFSHETDPLVQTPTFDRFAAEGIRWRRAYAANPVCTPNRSCLLTGRYSHQHGMIHNDIMLPPSEVCLAEPFQNAGYATHYVGKWHMDGNAKPGFVPRGWRRRGFATFEGFNRGHEYFSTPTFSDDGSPMNAQGYEPAIQTDLALDFIGRHRAEPWFCYLSWGPPHTPYRPPKEFDRFDPEKLAWRPNVPDELRNSPVLKRELAGYYGLCESLDHELSRLLRKLDELGQSDNTLIVFTADHGDMHGSHGEFRKGKPEEESLHVPLLMRLPGRIRAGQTTDTLASTIDLMPTILSTCGLDAPRACTGRDLSAVALGSAAPDVESVYAEGAMRAARGAERDAPAKGKRKQKQPSAAVAGGRTSASTVARGEWRALVTPEHKLVMDISGQVTGMFDLARDPYELTNLVEERGQSALREHLLKLANDWADRTDDPFPRLSTPAKVMYTDEEAAAARG